MHATPIHRIAAGITLVGASLLAFGTFAPMAQADTGPTPYEDKDDGEPGTRDCASYDPALIEFKIDSQPEDGDYFEGDAEVKGDLPDGFFISITGVDTTGDVVVFDWAAFVADGDDVDTDPDPFPIDIVLVKAGPGGIEYTYTAPGAVSDTDLESPKDSISHVTFCFDIPEEGTTGGDTTGGDTTGGTDDVLGTGGEADTTGGTTGGTPPPVEVAGEVIEPDTLPRTGDNDRSLAIIGGALVLIGGGIMLIRRNTLFG